MFPKRCSSSRLDQIKLRVNQLIKYVNCTKWHSCVHFLLPSSIEVVALWPNWAQWMQKKMMSNFFFNTVKGKVILGGKWLVAFCFVFLQFEMLEEEITAERWQVGAVYFWVPQEKTTAQSFTVYHLNKGTDLYCKKVFSLATWVPL